MRNICLIFIFLCLSVSVHAEWIDNYPVEVKQPDGTVLNLFVTGDEYHNRVHDAEGYTLLRNPEGWVVYATLRDGELVPTDIVYVQTNGIRRTKDAQDLGIGPNIDIPAEKWMQLRENFNNLPQKEDLSGGLKNAQAKSTTLRAGTMNNIVIYITFPEFSFENTHNAIATLYNSTTSGQSLKSYFRDISNGQFLINSAFFPTQNGSATVIAYQAPQQRSYYMIGNGDATGRIIEHTLLKDAIEHCRTQIEAALSATALDYDSDGYVDNINFVIQGDVGAWNTLLWPHKWSLYTYDVKLNGKKVYDYNLLLENRCEPSTLVHETYHTLGAPDLYMYSTSGTGISSTSHPVGLWDVMCSNATPPQSSSAYITNKYGQFISDIPEITSSGTYTLHDIWNRTGDRVAYKIASPTSTQGEYFVLEYRRKGGTLGGAYDTRIPNAGIIISRINPKGDNTYATGTAAKPFEMYVYRQGALNNTTPGNISNAVFKQGGLTTFSDSSSPNAFLSDNSPGLNGIVIDQFSTAGGETMTFRVIFPTAGIPIATSASNIKRSGFTANWNPSTNTQSYQLSVYYKNGNTKIYTDGGFQNKDVDKVISYNISGLDRTKATTWYYTVKAVSGNVPSGESNEIEVKLSDFDGVTCEYKSNMLENETPAGYSSNGGPIGGHANNYTQYAEYYQNAEAVKVTGFKMTIQQLKNNSNNPDCAKITMKIWDKGTNGYPKNVLYSEDFSFAQIGGTGERVLTFKTPTIVPAEFFIGYEIYYAPANTDVFGVYITSPRGVDQLNTAYVHRGVYGWGRFSSNYGNNFTTSLFLSPNTCTYAPESLFEVETSQTAGVPVTFTNTSLNAPNTIWMWNFGDGQTSTEENPTYTYNSAGNYTVTLKAENSVGESVATKTIQVNTPPSLTLAKGRTWYVSSPIDAAKANTTLADAGFVEYYDEPRTTPYSASDQKINGWVNIAGSENTLVQGKGYVLYTEGTGNTTFTFPGTLNAGNIEVPLTRSTTGFNLVGNPYLSHIDWNAISETNSFLEPTIWYRTRTDAYHFYTYNSESRLSDPDNLSYSLQYIPAMQGFWVRALNTGTLTFTESAMVDEATAGSGNTLKATKNGDTRPLVRLQLTDGKKTDRTVIFADKNAKDGFDRYDSGKMFNTGAAIYTVAENEKLIFNGLSAIETDTEIPLGFTTNHSGEYSIAAIAVEDFDGFEIMLKDNTLNTTFNITNGEAYEFSSDITDGTSRFSIIFRKQTDVLDNSDEVSVYDLGNTLHIQSHIPVKRVLVYNLAGKLLYNTTENTIYNVASGIYVVKVETENSTVSRKVIVK